MVIHQAYNILVVDDDDISQKYICHALQNQHSTICANNGEQGLELARHHHPDIIILDVQEIFWTYHCSENNKVFDRYSLFGYICLTKES